MSLPEVLTAIGGSLRTALGAEAALVGAARPTRSDELPAVTLWASEARIEHGGLGRLAEERQGALPLTVSLDLADPVAPVSGAPVRLLSSDRRTLNLANGPLVRADGTPDPPFTAGDLAVRIGTENVTIVADDPAAGEVRPDPATGTLRFGQALPATGELEIDYFIGRWEMVKTEIRTKLEIEVAAADAAGVELLSLRVAELLEPARLSDEAAGLRVQRAALQAWGPIEPPVTGGAGERRRHVCYDLAAGRLVAHLPSGGGEIRRVAVSQRLATLQELDGNVQTGHIEETYDVV